MNVSTQAWVVVADDVRISALVEAALPLGEKVIALVVGRREVADAVAVSGVDEVRWLGEPAGGVPVEAYALEVGRLVAEAAPRVVIGPATDAGRVLLGAIAAATGSPVLTGAGSIVLDGGRVVVERAVHGGIAQRRDAIEAGPAILALAPGGLAAVGAEVPIVETDVTPSTALQVTLRRETGVVGVELGSAKTIVGIGRGLKARADLELIGDLAAAAGAEIACSRPLAEGVDWVAKERYLGISGQHVAPDLYFAIGISGQIQHMVGVREAKVIVAINSDPAAPVFAECDFGIVGDLYEVVPALAAAVRASGS